MYSLKVKKPFVHPDGRIFETGHDCHALSAFEISELITDYPDNFESGDDSTVEFLKNSENVKHLSDAVKRGKAESLQARKK